MSSSDPLANNLTLKILADAEKGGYSVIAQVCYDFPSVCATVQAAEAARSPAMILLFPGTMRQFGPHFVRSVIEHCHEASVPVSVQVDHAQEEDDIRWILEELGEKRNIKVDSIMIDASHADDDEENIKQAKPFVDKAVSLGIAVEVELGRIAGGEAGIKTADSAALTQPEKAERFLSALNAQMLAPCIGNQHGLYSVDPTSLFHLDLLSKLQSSIGFATPRRAHLVLHGTDMLPDQLFRDCIARGCVKINVNSWCRDPQLDVWKQQIENKAGVPDMYDLGMKEYAKQVTRFLHLFGSAGKA